MNILALDPATKCGWATATASGVWDLSIRRDESSGMRLIRLESKLRTMFHAMPIDLVVFEAARHAAPKMQGALVVQAELQGVIKLFFEEANTEWKGYSPSEIKKFATGKGNANKAAMLKAARDKWGARVKDDNEADALWLHALAASEFGRCADCAPAPMPKPERRAGLPPWCEVCREFHSPFTKCKERGGVK